MMYDWQRRLLGFFGVCRLPERAGIYPPQPLSDRVYSKKFCILCRDYSTGLRIWKVKQKYHSCGFGGWETRRVFTNARAALRYYEHLLTLVERGKYTETDVTP